MSFVIKEKSYICIVFGFHYWNEEGMPCKSATVPAAVIPIGCSSNIPL